MEVGINDYIEAEHFRSICEDDYNVSRTCEYEFNSMHHIHNSCEILIIEEGVTDYYIVDEKYHLDPGDVLVIGSMHHHARNMIELPYLRYGLTVNPDYYRSFIFDSNLLRVFETPTVEDYNRYCKKISKEYFDHLVSLIRLLYDEQKSDISANPMKSQMEKALITEIAVTLYRAFRMNERRVIIDPYQEERMGKIRDYITTHYKERLSLETLSDIFYMHPSNISKYFHRYCGFTLNQYINTVRVYEAQKLLENTSLSIAVIAEEAGFGSVNNFIRQYKSLLKKTPERYRQEFRSFISASRSCVPIPMR